MHEKLGNIQALRGIAALLVVLFHAGDLEARFGLTHALLGPFRWFGYAGVDLFFALSGFVIAFVNRDRFGRARAVPMFLVRRLWRIYPTYWAVLAAAVAWWYVLGSGDPFASDKATQWLQALSLSPDPYSSQEWLPQAWTLSFELAFYLAYALLLPLPRRVAGAVLLAWFFAVVALVAGRGVPTNRFAALWLGPFVVEFLLVRWWVGGSARIGFGGLR